MSFKSSSFLNSNLPPTASFPGISAASPASSRRLGLNTHRSDKSNQSRIRQIILSNKKSLNNAVDTMAKTAGTSSTGVNTAGQEQQSSETFASFSKMPQIDSQFVYNLNYRAYGTDSMLIKNPFKQSQVAKTPRQGNPLMQSATNSQQRILTSAKTMSCQSCQLKPINGLDQYSQFNIYNPSTSLILKTANSINEFVDFFEKNRNATTNSMQRSRGIRLSRYAGLKPLNYVKPDGPTIKNCLGVVIEPKEGEQPMKLKEIYEQKLKQLAQKRAMESRDRANAAAEHPTNLNLESDQIKCKSPLLDFEEYLEDGGQSPTQSPRIMEADC